MQMSWKKRLYWAAIIWIGNVWPSNRRYWGWISLSTAWASAKWLSVKSFCMPLIVSLLLASSALAEQYTTYLNWATFPRPDTSIPNVIGENGEHMASWTFGYDEVLVWQPSNPNRQWWNITNISGTGYSTNGVDGITFESYGLSQFLDATDFYVCIRVDPGIANEWQSSGRQQYGGFTIVHFDLTSRILRFTSKQFFWDMVKQ